MSTSQPWTWKDGKPPGPQTVRAGERWTFRLPLEGTGQPPDIHWVVVPWDREAHRPVPDALTLEVDIPIHLKGIHTLAYRRGGNQLEDKLILKILPALIAEEAMSAPGATSAPPPPAAASGAPRPTPAEQGRRGPVTPPGHEPEPSQRPVPSPETAPGADTPEAQVNRATSRDPGAEYEVQVYRGGTPIPHLTRPLLVHKSLLVGKFSATRAIFPDIDLRNHFRDAANEALCSRQQARIYWADERVVLQNLGKSPIALPDGQSLPAGGHYSWRAGDEVLLPGGLGLRLETAPY